MGDLDTEHPWAVRIARGSGAVVISVGYRRAPEHRFPAALDDAYAALVWTAEHAAELGIDPARIAVGGHAPGAGLAAAVALRARDQQGPPIRFQLLNQPELDDRQETWSARNFTDTPFMTRDKVAASWGHYLGSHAGLAVRRPGAGRGPVRPAARLRRHRGVRPEPRRGHRLRAAPAAGGGPGRAAPVGRDVPRLAGGPVRRGLAAADRRTHRRPAPGPRRLTRRGRGGAGPQVQLRRDRVHEQGQPERDAEPDGPALSWMDSRPTSWKSPIRSGWCPRPAPPRRRGSSNGGAR